MRYLDVPTGAREPTLWPSRCCGKYPTLIPTTNSVVGPITLGMRFQEGVDPYNNSLRAPNTLILIPSNLYPNRGFELQRR